MLQKSSYAYKTLCAPELEGHHVHDPERVLLCTSGTDSAPQLMYFPSIWDLAHLYHEHLTTEDHYKVEVLADACQ